MTKIDAEDKVVPVVGMKATYCLWSDRLVYTIIAVSKSGKVVTVQRDIVIPIHTTEDLGWKKGGFGAVATDQYKQKWETIADPEGSIRKFSLRKNGRWCAVGDSDRGCVLILDVANEFYDYNF